MVTVHLLAQSRDGHVDAEQTVNWPAAPRAGDYIHVPDLPVKVKRVTWFGNGDAFVELARMDGRDVGSLRDYGWTVMGLDAAKSEANQ